MPPTPQTQPTAPIEQTHMSQHGFVYALVAAFVLLLAVGGYFIFRPTGGAPDKVMVAAREFRPEGSIYLTLSPLNSSYTGIYSFDLATNSLAKVVGKDNTASLTAHPAASSLIFSSNISLDSTKTSISPLQIFSMGEQGTLKQITNTKSTFKRHPSYSDALGLYVYGAKAGATALGINPNDFNIYTFKDGKESLVAQGALPALTPDGKSVVALRQDGLYLISLTSTTTQKIWGLDHGGSALNLQFTLSPSGKYIAWSIPNDGYIYIMSVNSWAPFKGSVTSKIQTHAFWPVFSPNEEYLAYEQVDWAPTPTNQKLVVCDRKTPQQRIVQDLKELDQQKMFVSGWR